MPVLFEAHLRHAVFYLQRVHALDVAYDREKSRLVAILNNLDHDWVNFQIGYAWAKSNFLSSNKAASLCSMYPARVTNLLPLRQNPQDRLDWHKTGLKAAQMLGLSQNIGTHLAGIGLALIAMGRLDKSITVLDQLVDVARQTGDLRLLAVGTLNLAVAWTSLGQLQRGRDFSVFSFGLFHVLKDTSGRARALGTQATAYAAMGMHRQAVRCFETCLRQHRKEQDMFLESGTLVNIGVSLSALGDYSSAVKALNEALVIVDRISDITSKGRILGNLANIHSSQGNYQEAFACF
jgi:tetratricopeptide (TPR) repeat protein